MFKRYFIKINSRYKKAELRKNRLDKLINTKYMFQNESLKYLFIMLRKNPYFKRRDEFHVSDTKNS